MAALKPTKKPIRWSYPITPSQVQTLIRSEPSTLKALEIFDSASSDPTYAHDLPTFSLLLSRLAKSNLLQPAESLLARILPETRQPVPESIFLPLLRAHALAHHPLLSLRLFKSMKTHYNVVHTHKSYTCILSILVADNKLKLAKTIYQEMKQNGIAPTQATNNVLIKALCGNARTLDSAVLVFRRMEKPDACSYNTLIDGLCKNGRIDDARKVFDEMGERKVEATVVTFTSFIDGLCKGGQVDEAVEVFEEMGRRGVKPNVVTYSCLLDGLCKGGRAEKAVGMLERMGKDRCVANFVTYSVLIDGLCREGKVGEAAVVLDRMRLCGRKPDAGLYGKVICGLCEAGKVNEAANFLDEMVVSEVLPNRVTWGLHVRINNMVVRGLCERGELGRGFMVYQSMRTRGISVEEESFRVLVGCYCTKKDVEKALGILEEMVIDGCVPECDIWRCVADGFLGRKKVKEGVELILDELVGEYTGSKAIDVESKSE